VAWVIVVEADLHDDTPDVDADVEDDDGVEAELGAAALREGFHVEDEAQAEAADARERGLEGLG
jgi:hypothetical protein